MLNNGSILQNRYKIMKILGYGGMGAVYLAEDQRLPTKWAVKEMKSEGLPEEEREEAVELFQSEARILSELRHRNLPRIVDFFDQNSKLYLVMDLVEGETLEQRIKREGPLSVTTALEMCLQIADVLDYLHSRKDPVVFRDFKPANVMLTENEEVKLIDFGIARVFKQDADTDTKALGTPGYAAPEQYGRGQSGPRTDLYAFGATMHHALSGRDPTEEPFQFPPLVDFRQDLPPELVELIHTCVNLKSDERPSSAFDVKRVLEQLLGTTGSSPLPYGRPSTTRLETGTEPPSEALVSTNDSSSSPVPVVSFSPKKLKVKELPFGERATLRLKVKSDRPADLVPNSPHLSVYPEKVVAGTTTVTVSVDSTKLEKGTLFQGAIEVNDLDDLAVPVEAHVGSPKASMTSLVTMYTLFLCTMIPLFNYLATIVGGIIIFSTPKPKRGNLKIPWRLNLLFTAGWTLVFVGLAFGISLVDWNAMMETMKGWVGYGPNVAPSPVPQQLFLF